MEIEGKPLIGYLLERLKKTKADKIILAIPEKDLQGFADYGEFGIDGYVGAELDVADRFAGALKAYPCDAFVRVCADSPLLDPILVDEAIHLFHMKRPDIACNIHPRTFPMGQCVEVVNTATFLEERVHFSESDKEHVTSFFYDHATDYDILNFEYHINRSNNSMVVDIQDDFDRMKVLIEGLQKPHTECGWQELLLASRIKEI
ncbi:hypothetical protein LCGC14_3041750 [marine sediment metagenome]|uniref:MobA-like NTP transferase domain-containing protein n=1 Tax=marine sediment metagenome TaxID=412755 RepID=A0A0F8WP83_9ZZZZ